MKHARGETITLMGRTTVEGINLAVELTVNTVQLIHMLGAKAAESKGARAQLAHGAVEVEVSTEDAKLVRDARRAKRQASRDRMRSGVLGGTGVDP